MKIFFKSCFKKSLVILALGWLAAVAEASDVSLKDLSDKATAAGLVPQEEFETISRDVGRAIFINPANSPEPLGILGFNAGIEVMFLKVDPKPFEHASGQSIPGSVLPAPRLRVQKGLPLGIDVGLAYLPETNKVNIGMYGGEVRIDFLESIPIPTPLLHLSGRVSYSRLTGIPNLKVQSYGVDLSGGVNFPFIKPYVGIGYLKTTSSLQNLEALGFGLENIFKNVNHKKSNYFAGVKLSLIPFVPINIEYSRSTRSALSVKAAVEF